MMRGVVEPFERQCSLLLFVATESEEQALEETAREKGLAFRKVRDPNLGQYHSMGQVGNETVIAVRPAREGGRVVMGPFGRLGSASRAVRFRQATGAQAIVQLGMAFGVSRNTQKHGDVLVSSSLIPYDNRRVVGVPRSLLHRVLCRSESYIVDYSQASRQPARPALVQLCFRERKRGGHDFHVHVGAMLSGAAQIQSARFRDELVTGVPAGEASIVGGEMEGVGLLAASTEPDDAVWCIVKGISDFADETRFSENHEFRTIACRNAARFLLSALMRDTTRE